MQGLRINATGGEVIGTQVVSALRSLAWKLGGEHLLFENLKDETTGFLSEAKLKGLLQQACSGSVSVSQALKCLDANGDGKVCEEDFKQVVRKLFEEQFASVAAGCTKAALTSMAQSIPDAMREKPAVQCLAGLSDEDLEKCAGSAMTALLTSLKLLRDEVKGAESSADQEKRKPTEASAKFEFQPPVQSFLFGTLSMFKQMNLETLIGFAAHPVREGMEREHQSTARFTTENYGRVSTFDLQEYDLIDKSVAVDYEFDGAREKRDVDEMLSSFNIREDGVWKRLTREELVALVLFTGPMGEKYNEVLSQVLLPIAHRMQAGEEIELDIAPVRYATTIHMIVSGISKLSDDHSSQKEHTVYRGLQGPEMLDAFTAGVKGGTGLGFMSTTRDISVATRVRDLESGDWPTVLEIETVGQVGRGASLAMISQYPREKEALFPPLCSLYVVGHPRLEWAGDHHGACWLVPARVEVSTRSCSREEHEERWKSEVLGTARALLLDTKTALFEKLCSVRKSNPEDGTELYESLLEEGRALQRRMRGLPAVWFNDDRNLEMALQDLITLRSRSIETMLAFCVDVMQRPAEHFMVSILQVAAANAVLSCTHACANVNIGSSKSIPELAFNTTPQHVPEL